MDSPGVLRGCKPIAEIFIFDSPAGVEWMSLRKGVDALRGAGIFHRELLLRVSLAASGKCDQEDNLLRGGRKGRWRILFSRGDKGTRN